MQMVATKPTPTAKRMVRGRARLGGSSSSSSSSISSSFGGVFRLISAILLSRLFLRLGVSTGLASEFRETEGGPRRQPVIRVDLRKRVRGQLCRQSQSAGRKPRKKQCLRVLAMPKRRVPGRLDKPVGVEKKAVAPYQIESGSGGFGLLIFECFPGGADELCQLLEIETKDF